MAAKCRYRRLMLGRVLGAVLLLGAIGVVVWAVGRPTSGVGLADAAAEGVQPHLEAWQRIADDNGGNRAAGTPGHEASADYVAQQLRDAGYEVTEQTFEIAAFSQRLPSRLETDGRIFADGPDIRALVYSGSGDVTAPVTATQEEGCDSSDFDDFPAGSIAVVRRGGPCLVRDLVVNAQDAGAAAVLVEAAMPTPNGVRRSTLLEPDGIEVPVLGITSEAGEAARAAQLVRVAAFTKVEQRETRNVIAAPATPASADLVVVGAHLDSVMDGPGVNDNGSGAAVVLELARTLPEASRARARFAFWSGEELALLGSRRYVQELDAAELRQIAMYLNFDMLGSPNGVTFVYDESTAPTGSAAVRDAFEAVLDARGLPHERHDLAGGSDHRPFEEAGIPVGGLYAGSFELKTEEQAASFGGSADSALDPCYHAMCDDLEGIDTQRLAQMTSVASAVLLGLLTP